MCPRKGRPIPVAAQSRRSFDLAEDPHRPENVGNVVQPPDLGLEATSGGLVEFLKVDEGIGNFHHRTRRWLLLLVVVERDDVVRSVGGSSFSSHNRGFASPSLGAEGGELVEGSTSVDLVGGVREAEFWMSDQKELQKVLAESGKGLAVLEALGETFLWFGCSVGVLVAVLVLIVAVVVVVIGPVGREESVRAGVGGKVCQSFPLEQGKFGIEMIPSHPSVCVLATFLDHLDRFQNVDYIVHASSFNAHVVCDSINDNR